MPLSGPTSYSSTLRGFQNHWETVNSEPDAPLDISDPRNPAGPRLGIAILATLMGELETHTLAIADHNALGDVADADLAESKRSALDASQEFGRKVRGEGRLRHLAPRLPALPTITDGEGPFMNAMTSVRQRWKTAEALLAAPFLLGSGENHTTFSTRLATLATKFEASDDADIDASVSRQRREEVQGRAREILSSYRAAVEARFAPDHPLVLSLPNIYPTPGHTPDAVALTATWDAATSQAILTWPASTDADLSHYEIRANHTGTAYSAEDERLLARIEKDAPRELRTTDGLTQPGKTAHFRIYVVLTTGNERGSETAEVKRPG